MPEYLFSYGTLQKEKTQLELFGRKLQGHPDSLPGYSIKEVTITDEKFLATGEDPVQRIVSPSGNKNDSIPGTALEVTVVELVIADRYEPPGYKRVAVTLASGKKAWIYAADQPGHAEFLRPWRKTDENRFSFEKELKRELIPGHPLYAKQVEAIAFRRDMDEVMFRVKDNEQEFAVVHLTYNIETNPACPGTTFYKDWQAIYDQCIVPEHQDWLKDQ
jgi:hypothetical protein